MNRVILNTLEGNNKRIKTILYLLENNQTPLCSEDMRNIAHLIKSQVNNSELIIDRLLKEEDSRTASYE